MDNAQLIKALKTVPEKKLMIVSLAPELLDKKGEIDYQKVLDRQKEVNLALAEAQACCHGTQTVIHALQNIGPREPVFHVQPYYPDDDPDDENYIEDEE